MAEWTAPDRSGSRAVLIGASQYTELAAVPAAANSLDAGKPVPTRSSRDMAEAFVFARNTAPRPKVAPVAAGPPGGDLVRRYRLLDDAESAARTIENSEKQYYALVSLAREAAPDDPDRARRLLEEILGVISTVKSFIDQALLVWAMAAAILRQDPAWARRLLAAFEQGITSPYVSRRDRDSNLANCHAEPELLRLDPDRTERLAHAITDQGRHGAFLRESARSVAARNPTRAELMARSTSDEESQGDALAAVISTIVEDEPDRAERIARSITDLGYRAGGLAAVAAVLGARDLDRARDLLAGAERAATDSGDDIGRCQLQIVMELTSDGRLDRARRNAESLDWLREQARRIACAITTCEDAAYAAMSSATAMLPDKPDDALALLNRAAAKHREIPDSGERRKRSYILRDVVQGMIRLDMSRAIEVARSMPLNVARDQAYVAIVEMIARSDPIRAERIAHQIAIPGYRAPALVVVAAAVVANDPENAAALLDHARRVARAVGRDVPQGVARNVAIYDPELAVEILASDSDPEFRDEGLARIVTVVTRSDVDRAEAIARTISDPLLRCESLIHLARLQRP